MKILIVTNIKLNEKPEIALPKNPLVKHLKEQGDSVSIFHCEDDETYLANYINENGESLFQEVKTKRLYDRLTDIDVIYITYPSKLALKVLEASREMNVPVVAEYVYIEPIKRLFKSFYKYINAIHFLNKEDQENLELKAGRRVNGHIFEDDVTKLRKMLIQYGDECNHNSKKKLYYSDELNDDFALNKIKVKKGKKPFKYVHTNLLWIAGEVFAYRVIAKPLIWLLNKITFHQRIKNKYVLKKCKHKGYFIYGNHTNGMADAFTPNLLSRKKNYIVVSRETVSIKGLKGIVTMLGAIPVYSDMDEVESFNECINTRIKQGKSVAIYPEAHIWPYYTKIRHFKKDSFRYPVDLNAPVYVLTNTWQKRRVTKKAKLVSYLSGPLYPDETLSRSEAMEDLKERVYLEMIKVTRSVKQIEKIQYIKVDKD